MMFLPEVPGIIDYVPVIKIVVTKVTNSHGDSVTTEVEQDFPRCLFEPEQSTERTDRRSAGVTSPAKVYIPPPGHVSADDVLDINGERWQVDGNPSVWGNVGTEAALKRWGKAVPRA